MSGLRGIGRSAREEDTAQEEAAREDAFQRRTRSQRHLRTHGPLLRVLIERAGEIDLESQPGEFERRIQEARGLAVRVAAEVLGKPVAEVDVDEAQPYRQECAEAVAFAWRRGASVAADAFVAEMVRAVHLAGQAADYDPVPWKLLTPPGNMALSVVPSVMRLRHAVDVYDFRLGRDAVTAFLTRLAAEESAAAVHAILPPGATLVDRRSLYQSVLREYTHDLRALYERTARRTVEALVGLGEEARVAHLAEARPLDAIAAAFRAVARRNTELNAAAVQAAMGEFAAAAPAAAQPGH